MLIRRVVGPSMEPTLLDGDIVFAKKIKANSLFMGDIVISHYKDRDLIKRIADIKGDNVSLEGDNTEYSNDSRNFGYIPISSVKGRVFMIWPKAARWPRAVTRFE